MDYSIVETATKTRVGRVVFPWTPDNSLDAIEIEGGFWLVGDFIPHGADRRLFVRRIEAEELASLGVRVLWRANERGEMRPRFRDGAGKFVAPGAPFGRKPSDYFKESRAKDWRGWGEDVFAETVAVKDDR